MAAMKLVLLTIALWLSITAADKLDKTYLPPPGAKTAGGGLNDLQTPLEYPKNDKTITKLNSENINNGERARFDENVTHFPFPVFQASDIIFDTVVTNTTSDFELDTTIPSMDIFGENLETDFDIETKENSKVENKYNAYLPNAKTSASKNKLKGINDNDVVFANSDQNPHYADQDTIFFVNQKQVPKHFDSTFNMEPEQTKGYNTKLFENDLNNPFQEAKTPQGGAETNASILKYHNVVNPNDFSYEFDTSNGIHKDESGTAIDGVRAVGSYSYVGDDSKVYMVTYTADENGFRPQGDHLPTSPPLPEAIRKIVEQAERDKEAGIYHDGFYDETRYGYENYEIGATHHQIMQDGKSYKESKNSNIKVKNQQRKSNRIHTVNQKPNTAIIEENKTNNGMFGNKATNNVNLLPIQNINNIEKKHRGNNANNALKSQNRKIEESQTQNPLRKPEYHAELTETKAKNEGLFRDKLFESRKTNDHFYTKGFKETVGTIDNLNEGTKQVINYEYNIKDNYETTPRINDETESYNTGYLYVTPTVKFDTEHLPNKYNIKYMAVENIPTFEPKIKQDSRFEGTHAHVQIYEEPTTNVPVSEYVTTTTSELDNGLSDNDNAFNENTLSPLDTDEIRYTPSVNTFDVIQSTTPLPSIYESTNFNPRKLVSSENIKLVDNNNKFASAKMSLVSPMNIKVDDFGRTIPDSQSFASFHGFYHSEPNNEELETIFDNFGGDKMDPMTKADKGPLINGLFNSKAKGMIAPNAVEVKNENNFADDERFATTVLFDSEIMSGKIIGEDFSGPKQAPKFDPDTGYYYK